MPLDLILTKQQAITEVNQLMSSFMKIRKLVDSIPAEQQSEFEEMMLADENFQHFMKMMHAMSPFPPPPLPIPFPHA